MTRAIFLRIVLGLGLLLGMYLFPYWLVIVVAAVIAVFIPYYFEFIALVVAEETLYHATGSALWFPAALFAGFIILEIARSLTRERFLRI